MGMLLSFMMFIATKVATCSLWWFNSKKKYLKLKQFHLSLKKHLHKIIDSSKNSCDKNMINSIIKVLTWRIQIKRFIRPFPNWRVFVYFMFTSMIQYIFYPLIIYPRTSLAFNNNFLIHFKCNEFTSLTFKFMMYTFL